MGGAHTIAVGLKSEQGAEPPEPPLTLATGLGKVWGSGSEPECHKKNIHDLYLSYTDRLKCLGLTTLELRRLHLDLIYCYKIVFGMVAINFSDIFEFSHVNKTRGHTYKLFKSHSNNSTRYRFFFAERVSCQRVEFLASKCKLQYPW